MQTISFGRLEALAETVALEIRERITPLLTSRAIRAYAVPRGGIPAALAISKYVKLMFVDYPDKAEIIIDDLIDSGATMQRPEFAGKPFFALIDKRSWENPNEWVVWPWEGNSSGGIEDNVRRLIQYVGEDSARQGLQDTPKRVAKAWKFWCSGYEQKVADFMVTFEDGAEGADEMVVVKDIPFYSHCEHHMAPFFGTATIGYLPNRRIIGLSKLNRVMNVFSRRLQVQERLTCQVAEALMQHLEPLGAGVVIRARHLCMESRGVCQQGHHTVTSALRGIFKEEPGARSEFLRLAGC